MNQRQLSKIVKKNISNILKESADFKRVADLISNGYLVHCSQADFDEFGEQYIKGGCRAKEGYGFYI